MHAGNETGRELEGCRLREGEKGVQAAVGHGLPELVVNRLRFRVGRPVRPPAAAAGSLEVVRVLALG